MYCRKLKLKTLYRICCPCELWAFLSHPGEEMPAVIVCKSCGRTEAKEILFYPSPLPPPPKTLSSGRKKLLTQALMHTHTSVFMPPSDLPASSCPSFPGSWSCWDTGVGEILYPLCDWDQMNKVNKALKILKKSSRRRRKRWREELRVEEERESQELCDPGGLCHLHLCTGGKETGMLLLAWR